MSMAHQQYFGVLLGGLLVGVAAGMALLANGRVAGVSGMISNAVGPRSADAVWQALFLVGLVAGGMGLAWLDPAALPVGESAPLQLMIGAGLLVGFGARMVDCRTSGHALCGVGRISRRSVAAMGCFIIGGAVAGWASFFLGAM
jgi:uncharacterized membrane protein YedE/YeeE